ncbi:MAG: ATP synthase subunit I [Rhodocyclaceae bacterium]
MYKVVLLQFGAALVSVALGAMFFGTRGAISALIGGCACLIPSLLFAWRLSRTARTPGASHVSAFFVGEAIKIASAIGILAAAHVLYSGVHWGAVVIGLVVTLQANFFGLLVKS